MLKHTAKFVNPDGRKLFIRAKTGKRGIHLAATLRTPGAATQTGCRQSFHVDAEAEAKAAYEILVADALKQGWVAEAIKQSVKNSFTSIPLATPKVKKSAAA